ncbi:MAG: 3-oxoacyl-ACP synthase III [bacterium]|nr:3-oxoacyl-ACP synthase III [bacterium]
MERGCTVAITTDTPLNPISHLRDLVVFAIREGLDPERALETVTINPARVLVVEDRVGSLALGKDADFTAISDDPWNARNKVQATYIDGRNVFDASGPHIPDGSEPTHSGAECGLGPRYLRESTSNSEKDTCMSGNAAFSYSDTAIVSIAHEEAPEVVASAQFDERLAETYARVGGQAGLLESLAGIKERRWWPEGYLFTDAAAAAGAKAIEAGGVRVDEIGLLIDTSVCRDRLEPSSAVTVHNALDLPSWCLNFDMANACLGFMNALQIAGNMIESGQINYALIVDGEGSRRPQEATLERLAGPEATMADLFAEFATLTLGSGGAAAVVGRHSDNPGSHRLVRGISRADTAHHNLCVGTLDRMRTDTRGLLNAGLDVSKLAWGDAEEYGWLDADRYIIHQVSQVHTTMLCERLGIDLSRVPLTFPMLGNVGPASIPITLSLEADKLQAGDRVMMLGMGSGINAMATELIW